MSFNTSSVNGKFVLGLQGTAKYHKCPVLSRKRPLSYSITKRNVDDAIALHSPMLEHLHTTAKSPRSNIIFVKSLPFNGLGDNSN